MEISGIIMETFTLGTVVGLNITHDASFYAESVNAAAWNRARLVEAFMKSTRLESSKETMGGEYRSLAKQVFGNNGVFCLTETRKEQYIRRELPTLYFEFNWKSTLSAKREDKHWQSNC